MHDVRTVDRRLVVLEVFFAHRFGRSAIPRLRIDIDGALGLVWLGKEEPMPPLCRKAAVATLQMLEDRDAIDFDKVRYTGGMIHRHPECGKGATGMPGDGETIKNKPVHESHAKAGLCPL